MNADLQFGRLKDTGNAKRHLRAESHPRRAGLPIEAVTKWNAPCPKAPEFSLDRQTYSEFWLKSAGVIEQCRTQDAATKASRLRPLQFSDPRVSAHRLSA
jgi:hypothetical protein